MIDLFGLLQNSAGLQGFKCENVSFPFPKPIQWTSLSGTRNIRRERVIGKSKGKGTQTKRQGRVLDTTAPPPLQPRALRSPTKRSGLGSRCQRGALQSQDTVGTSLDYGDARRDRDPSRMRCLCKRTRRAFRFSGDGEPDGQVFTAEAGQRAPSPPSTP